MSRRILLVDDDRLYLRGLQRLLTRNGYTVRTASTVKEAVAVATAETLDAAIVDYDLAEENGLQVLARLRKIQPRCLRMLISAHTDYQMAVDAINRGEIVRVIRKQFSNEQLLATIEEAFEYAERQAQIVMDGRHHATLKELKLLEECLEGQLMRLALQPIVRATGEHDVVAYEALLRSLHPGLPTPGAILDAALRNDRLRDVARVVFGLAGRWLAQLPPQVGLFVNLHPEQLGSPTDLMQDLEPLLSYARRVTIEITERSTLDAIKNWEESQHALTGAGFTIAIDDLGSGNNGLMMLAALEPRYIKLDMQLVRDIHTKTNNRKLVQMLTGYAEWTEALIIAEGVETESEAAVLIDCGVHLLQGYYFARPSMEGHPPMEPEDA